LLLTKTPLRVRLALSLYYLQSTDSLDPELHVKTVKYFKSIERVQDEVEAMQAELRAQEKAARVDSKE
jgi:hypothetical protein